MKLKQSGLNGFINMYHNEYAKITFNIICTMSEKHETGSTHRREAKTTLATSTHRTSQSATTEIVAKSNYLHYSNGMKRVCDVNEKSVWCSISPVSCLQTYSHSTIPTILSSNGRKTLSNSSISLLSKTKSRKSGRESGKGATTHGQIEGKTIEKKEKIDRERDWVERAVQRQAKWINDHKCDRSTLQIKMKRSVWNCIWKIDLYSVRFGFGAYNRFVQRSNEIWHQHIHMTNIMCFCVMLLFRHGITATMTLLYPHIRCVQQIDVDLSVRVCLFVWTFFTYSSPLTTMLCLSAYGSFSVFSAYIVLVDRLILLHHSHSLSLTAITIRIDSSAGDWLHVM